VYWIRSNGELRRYGSIDPGGEYEISTFVGDSWLLRDSDGRDVAVFVAAHDEDLAIVDQSTKAPQRKQKAPA
ncbi:MAG: hypothetical protein ACPHJ3_13275, partial [Rubripirellula sp.]